MAPTVGTVLDALHTLAPPELAEPWDNVGLLVGDPRAACRRVLVALDVSAALLARAVAERAQLIITHHPPIFTPLRRITADEPPGPLVLEAARRRIALAAAHTNLDVAEGGVSDVLAALLDLEATEPLARSERSGLAKIVVFTPAGDLEAVIAALAAAGAGVIGQYRECTFRTPGTGTFRGLQGAHPTIGKVGRREEVEELRLEAVVPLALAGHAVAAARAAHSYEEPAIDVYPLEGGRPSVGLGRCGNLPQPMPAAGLLALIRKRLALRSVRTVGDLRREVSRVAVLGGSGGKYVDAAARAGCQLYLTGELSHHQAQAAEDAGLVVADAGHAGTEQPAVPDLARRLAKLCPGVAFKPIRARGPFAYT